MKIEFDPRKRARILAERGATVLMLRPYAAVG
jgi:hypothetical protein